MNTLDKNSKFNVTLKAYPLPHDFFRLELLEKHAPFCLPPLSLLILAFLNLHKIKAARNKCLTSKEQRTCFKCKPSIKVKIIAKREYCNKCTIY